jgi:hypothetical protein
MFNRSPTGSAPQPSTVVASGIGHRRALPVGERLNMVKRRQELQKNSRKTYRHLLAACYHDSTVELLSVTGCAPYPFPSGGPFREIATMAEKKKAGSTAKKAGAKKKPASKAKKSSKKK